MSRSPLPPNAVRFISLATFVIVVTILYFASAILVPLALAILFTFLLTPLVARLERRRIARTPAVIAVVAVCVFVILIIGWVVVRELGHLADNLDRYRGNIATKIEELHLNNGPWTKLTEVGRELQQKLSGASPTTQASPHSPSAVQPTVASPTSQPTAENPLPVAVIRTKTPALETVQHYFGVLLGPLATTGLVIVLVIFILIRREDMRDRIIKLVAQGSLTVTTQALDDAGQRISRYLLMECMINGGYGVLLGIGLWLIGIPSAFLWGLFTAILRFVPYIGAWIAAFFPLALSLAVFPGYRHFIYTALLYIIVEASTVNFLEPYLYGTSTGMSEVAILLAAVFWTWLWGPIGLLLTMPMTTVLVVMGKYIPQLSFLNTLLGDQPVLAPHMRYYQRLLAMDREESEQLAEEYLRKMPLEDVYDTVVIPALALAEEDRRVGHLDESRDKFIRDAVGAHIQRLGEARAELEQEEAKRADESELQKIIDKFPRMGPDKALHVGQQKFHATPKTGVPDIHVLCLPAHSQGDGLIAAIVAQCLEIRGFTTHAVDSTALTGEVMEQVLSRPAQLIAVSALPPNAVRHARYLCKRLQQKGIQLPIVVGLWNSRTEARFVQRRISPGPNIHVASSLCALIGSIDQLARQIKIDHGH